MTKEEIIKQYEMAVEGGELIAPFMGEDEKELYEMLKAGLSALRPITREQVEKVWRGEWEPGNPICPICGKDKFDGLDADIWADWMPNFCPHCGAPMTDKAVDMVMERLEALRDEKG